MSEKTRRCAGFILVLCVFVLLAAGLLPLHSPSRTVLHARNDMQKSIEPIPSLSETDVFNSGDHEALLQLPGIGETLAAQIIEERTGNGPFFFAEDILSVKGIGSKKLEQLRPFLRFVSDKEED